MKREIVSPWREWTTAGLAGDKTRFNRIGPGTTDQPARLWRAILLIGLVSALMNLLMLVSVIFVVGVFREVIPKHDINRLLALLAIVILAYVFYALLRLGHARVLRKLADAIEQGYERAAFRAAAKSPMANTSGGQDAPVRDLGRIRVFILEGALAGLFDLPWTFVFVGMLSIFHVLLAAVSLAFALATAALIAVADHLSGRVREFEPEAVPLPAGHFGRRWCRTSIWPRGSIRRTLDQGPRAQSACASEFAMAVGSAQVAGTRRENAEPDHRAGAGSVFGSSAPRRFWNRDCDRDLGAKNFGADRYGCQELVQHRRSTGGLVSAEAMPGIRRP